MGTKGGITWSDDNNAILAAADKDITLRLHNPGKGEQAIELLGPAGAGYGEYVVEFTCVGGLDPNALVQWCSDHRK